MIMRIFRMSLLEERNYIHVNQYFYKIIDQDWNAANDTLSIRACIEFLAQVLNSNRRSLEPSVSRELMTRLTNELFPNLMPFVVSENELLDLDEPNHYFRRVTCLNLEWFKRSIIFYKVFFIIFNNYYLIIKSIDWTMLVDIGHGSRYWSKNEAVRTISMPVENPYPCHVLGGVDPQKIFNNEAKYHIFPDADNSNQLEIGIGLEIPETNDESVLSSTFTTLENISMHLTGTTLDATSTSRDRRFEWFSSGGLTTTTASTTTTSSGSEPLPIFSIKKTKVMVSNYYTQLSKDSQDDGMDGCPFEIEKVKTMIYGDVFNLI